MEHGILFESVKRFYPKYYTKDNVKTFVKARKITEADYKEITGDDYVA